MNKFSGKAIYCPTGKAGEYATYACNFFVGCSNGCEYCYLKKGIGAKVLGIDHPELKKCFKDFDHAKEVLKNFNRTWKTFRSTDCFFRLQLIQCCPKPLN